MKNVLIRTAMLFLIPTFIFSCHCDDDADDSCLCPEYYNPVCGEDGVVYSNECFAECADVAYTEGFCEETHDGLVLDLGNPAADGCGWVIEFYIDNLPKNFRPDTLDAAFQVDSLQVSVTYQQQVETSPCGFGGMIPVIDIIEID